MNKELIKQVIEHFNEVPARLRMTAFWISVDRERSEVYGGHISRDHRRFVNLGSGYGEPKTQRIPICKTVHCVAGAAVLIHDGRDAVPDHNSIPARAREILDLTYDQSTSLFYPDRWPGRYSTMYRKARSQKERVRILTLRLKYLLKTGK